MKEEKSLPIEITEVFNNLQKEIVWLHGRWIIFEQLYSKSEKTVELLNTTAASYFYVTQKSLYYDILMSLSRILDEPHFGKDENLSLEIIIELLDKEKFSNLVDKLREILKKIERQKTVLKKYRNKVVAHKDLDVALKKAEVFSTINITDIENLLKIIREFMNECEYYFLNSETGYDYFSMPTGARQLITQLQKAKAYDELEKAGLIERGYWIKNLRKNENEH